MLWHLAQVNVARLVAPLDDPQIADFVNGLEVINALAESSSGFVWRLQTDEGDATALRISPDERVIVNVSVWESIEALAEFAYRSGHIDFLRRRREWFERYASAHLAMWWVPEGHVPDLTEAVERLECIDSHGPTPRAFTFREPFAPPGSDAAAIADERDACPA